MAAAMSIISAIAGEAGDNAGASSGQGQMVQNPLMTPGGGQVSGTMQPTVSGGTQQMGGQSAGSNAMGLTNSIMNMAMGAGAGSNNAQPTVGSMYTNTPDYAGTDPMYNYFWEY